MSFDQDPNEQANISGADLAIMIDEIESLRNQLAEAEAKVKELEKQLGYSDWTVELLEAQLEAVKGQGEPVEVIMVDDCDEGYDARYGQVLIATRDSVKTILVPSDEIAQEPAATVQGGDSAYLRRTLPDGTLPYPHPAPSTEKVSQEPDGWILEASPEIWDDLNPDERSFVVHTKDDLRDATADGGYKVTAFYFTPPSTALSEELIIRKCAGVCVDLQLFWLKAEDKKLDEKEYGTARDYGNNAMAALNCKNRILALLQSPPTLEAHDRELAIKVAREVFIHIPESSIEVESIVDAVLKDIKCHPTSDQ